MRDEQQIFGALIQWARESENIRAIIVNGSRGDPSRIPDELSDYDVAIIVRNTRPIIDDQWIDRFGDVMVGWPLTPEPTFSPQWITQLLLFQDGVRIDFQFTTPDIQELERAGPFHCVLLDHDRLTESIAGTPIEGTRIGPPTESEFADRINAFWWDIPYVAKALRRDELDYARYVMEGDLRFNKLHPLLRWRIGAVQGPDTDVGIFGRWFRNHLEPELWERYLATFSGSDAEDQWRAMFAMTSMVGLLGRELAATYGFPYPARVDEQVTAYLRKLSEG